MQVTATDADDPTYGNSARLVYSILQGQPYFSVEPQTGIIRTALPNMDREARQEYDVLIQAKDMGGHMGGLSGTTEVKITLTDVNDNPPKFPQSVYAMSVSEDKVPGEEVGRLKAKDPDMGDNGMVNYKLIDGDGMNMFEMSTDSETREAVIKLKKPVDFETKRSYTLKVEGSNPHIDPQYVSWGPYKDEATIKISVEDADEPPAFVAPSYTLRYMIPLYTDIEQFFSINPEDGMITTKRPLDREAQAWHNISASATEIDVMAHRQHFTFRLAPEVAHTTTSPSKTTETAQPASMFSGVLLDSRGTILSCNVEPYVLAAGLSTGALIAILACIVILLAIVVLFVALRRQKKEPLIVFEGGHQGNIITYDDEGGGEEDTEAFDIATLQNPDGANGFLPRKDIKPELHDATAPPYDSIQIYGYEGRGSLAGSLSSLESVTTESDLDYDYLQSWGPRFKKLADLYGTKDCFMDDEDEEDS
ncbi:hypothetical protein KUCAC02_033585 [Chaenocephalus aceratus]|nr:hypothetical protein KUCAC02_033585 [Chaenocephalus aceratus]